MREVIELAICIYLRRDVTLTRSQKSREIHFRLNITIEGKRHLGAAIGSSQFKTEYIDEKVKNWTSNIETLAEIGKSQPHAAYAAFIHGEQHKYTYFKRTIFDISENLKPLDNVINNKLIPSLFGCEING